MRNLPPQYRNKITIDSKLNSINGFTEKKNNNTIDIPEEIQTIRDLFIKRYQLPRWMNYISRYNVIADIMRSDISIDDIQDESIRTREDFRLCLLSLVCNCTVICEDGNEHSVKELWGSDIVNVDINNHMLINKDSHFGAKHNVPRPNIDIKNLIQFEFGNGTHGLYGLTTADKETIKNAGIHGIEEDEYIITTLQSTYVDTVCALLEIDSPENNIDLFNVTKNGLASIKSRDLDLNALIAPRDIPYMDEPWKDYDVIKNYELLTDN